MKAITITHLKKYFGDTKAVDDISFEVEGGEIMGYLGPNGAGKTTTIRCMMDFLYPESGKIVILGKDAQDYAAELKKDIGFLSGEVSLYENWSGNEHITLVRSMRGGKTREKELMSILQFDPKIKVKNLSTGNKQKLGIILALMHNQRVLILDEPTTGLDPLLQEAIYKILREIADKGTTIFFSSHNLPEVEKICDRVCIIKQGKIVAVESVSKLKEKRMYSVSVTFGEKVDKEQFVQDGVDVVYTLNGKYELTVRGNIGDFIKKIKMLDIKDLEITHARLEDIFLEYYQ